MKVQTVLVLVVALVLGGAAVWLIAPLVMSRGSTSGGNASVVTATLDIARGGTIQADMIHLESVPKQWANPKSITRIEEAIGRVVAIPILAGEPVLETKIAGKGAGVGLAAIIPKGMRVYYPDADRRHRRGRVHSARQQGRRALDGEGDRRRD